MVKTAAIMNTEILKAAEALAATSFEDVLKDSKEAQKAMEDYKKQQSEITNILGNPTYESINQLCN
jgi:hypothetical protein